jgi:hypothetical protein
MNDTYFIEILKSAIAKMTALAATRDSIEVELIKLRELVQATANMLSDEKTKDHYRQILNDALEHSGVRDGSLVDAVRKVLQEARGHFLTVSQVRDRLRTRGFDFSKYKSNELASISTTLRRFKPEEVEITNTGGVSHYRYKRSRMAEAFAKNARQTRFVTPGTRFKLED